MRVVALAGGVGGAKLAFGLGRQRSLGVRGAIRPMSHAPVRREVRTEDGGLEFKDYFVRGRQDPVVHEVRFVWIDQGGGAPRVRGELGFADAIVIAPSN